MTVRQAVALILSLGMGLLAMAVPVALTAHAGALDTIRFVSPMGVDTGACTTPAAPCRTLQYAVDRAAIGDTIRVAGGTYTGVHTRPAPAGYEGSAQVTQVLYVDHTVSIQGGYDTGFAGPPDLATHPTILDAQGQGRVLFIAGDISPTVSGLMLTGGDPAGLGGSCWDGGSAGGGLYVLMATATISGNQIAGNSTGGQGGGVCLFNSQALLAGNHIHDNTGYDAGGLVLCASPAMLRDNIVEHNVGNRNGGGLFLVDSPAILSHNVIASNTVAWYGGGLNLTGSDARLDANDIRENVAHSGGGVYIGGGAPTLTGNQILSNTLTGDEGGGLHLAGTSAVVRGNTIAGNSGEMGGGLSLYASPARIADNDIRANMAVVGGGLRLYSDSNALVSGNRIVANVAQHGGGLAAETEASIVSNTFAHNAASSHGGAISIGAYWSPRVSANQILSNTAGIGGGINVACQYENPRAAGKGQDLEQSSTVPGTRLDEAHTLSDVRLNGNTVRGNTATTWGGGLCLGKATIQSTRNVIAGNLAGDGGGTWLGSGQIHVVNDVVVDNECSHLGGGLYSAGWNSHVVEHTTIARNRGGDGSGIYVENYTFYMRNTIIASQTIGIYIVPGFHPFVETTLWGDGAWANGTDWAGAPNMITNTVDYWGDPAFVDPDAGDYHIGAASAAIDRGLDLGLTYDLDLQPRPYAVPDIGADEYWPPGALWRTYLPLVVRMP